MAVKALVLDSWAIMAWLKGEACAPVVERYLMDAFGGRLRLSISVLNLGEIYYLTAKYRNRSVASQVLQRLDGFRVATLPAPNDLVMKAARLKAGWPISYADSFAAATALDRNEPLVTGDPELRALGDGEGLLLDWLGI